MKSKHNPKKFHGYLILPRHAILLREHLGHLLFSLYIALVMDARWFRANPQIGRVIGTQAEIASRLGISQSALSRGLDKLNAKDRKYAIRRFRYILLGFFPLFLKDVADQMYSKDYANLDDLYDDLHKINAELQEKYAKSQETRGQNSPQRLYSSSKDDLSSSEGGSSGEELVNIFGKELKSDDEK